jgi:hypothetical protein
MVMRRGAMALGAVMAAFLFSATLVAQNDRNQNEKENQPPKLTKAQEMELQAINKIVDAVVANQPAPNELNAAWLRHDVLKAEGNKQYVPFTLTLDPGAVTAKSLTVYWRVVPQGAAVPPPPAESKDPKTAAPPPVEIAYVDMTTTGVPSASSGPARISRSFSVPAGSYDVFVVVKEPTPERPARNAPMPKASLVRQTVVVPDLWNGELNTSSVFVAQRIDPLPAPLSPQQQAERPYALGTMEIVPVAETKFAKSGELSTFLLIYNARTDAMNKPDVSVEFNFYAKQAGAEKFFNRTNPQNLNAQTLPPAFDFAAGHQLQAGQAVPLASFPEGEYRLEIKVTDKLATRSVTRDVNFTVSGS